MEVKQKILTPLVMVKDVIDSKQKDGNYYHAKNLRFGTHLEESDGGFTVEKGNLPVFSLPEITVNYNTSSLQYVVNGKSKSLPYKNYPDAEIKKDFADGRKSGNQIITGFSVPRDGLLLFSTDGKGFDCVWYVADTEGVKEIELKYCRNMNLSLDWPIKAISNYENARIDKTYWIDGLNQQRSINISDPDLINVKLNVLDMVGNFNMSQPAVKEIFSGGSHTSGMIQYAYNLYRLNGSQTKISPMSELVSLDKGTLGGGALNETVSRTVTVLLENLDDSYTNVKLYAIKYTSFNQAPSISVVMDQGISSSKSAVHYDDGSILTAISNETFLFLGGEILIPNEMSVKINRMFLGNYVEKAYELLNDKGEDVESGCRSFSYDATGMCVIADFMKRGQEVPGLETMQLPGDPLPAFSKNSPAKPIPTFSCINPDYSKYIYNKDGAIGGSGEFLKYTLTRSEINTADFSEEDAEGRFFKDGELYRISIQFYSKYGEVTTPKWMADFVTQQTSSGNLNGFYGTLKVELLPAFDTWLNTVKSDQRPVGYKILRAERKSSDKTIIAQGLLNGMIAIGPSTDLANRPPDFSKEAKDLSHSWIKIPSMMRFFDDSLCPMFGNKSYLTTTKANTISGNARYGSNDGYTGNVSEIFSSRDRNDYRKYSYQFNSMMQFNCPEIEFDILNRISSNNMTVIGSIASSQTLWWGQETHISSKAIVAETKTKNCISPFDKVASVSGNLKEIKSSWTAIQDHGLVGPSGSDSGFDSHQFYREYGGLFTFNKKRYDILGEPEIAERGQGKKTYKKDGDLSYTNSIEVMSSDTGLDMNAINGKKGVEKVDSWACRSAFVVLGSENQKTVERKKLEEIFAEMGFVNKKSALLAEFRVSDILLYVGSLYGGNSYEDKKRTNYIEIGSYKKISEKSVFIKSPGDTFVGDHKFERISRKNLETSDQTVSYITEIVSYKTESTINMRKRNDLSISEWDNKFMPEYDQYAKYNRVYSQEPNLIYRKGNDYNFRAVTSFETSLIATKQKLPNEPIDSWTDILVNEQLDLDGRHGSINSIVSFMDELYVFQDRAIARLSILPRVQIAGDDGIAVQLGTGQLFNEYKYIDTKSGCINRWGTCVGERGIYYIDALNKSFCIAAGSETKNLSDEQGFHKEFQRLINIAEATKDNPIKKTGVSMGFDQITKDVYISVYDGLKCTTIAYNEKKGGFTSYYSYDAPIYIFNKKEMLTVDPSNGSTVYKNFEGKHNVFYGKREDSEYAMIVSPESMVECIFNNIEYNSLSRDKDGKEVNKTWETVRVHNEFQDSGVVQLVDRTNIRKKNRQYRITLPRQANSRDRIRNNWAMLELKMTNEDGNSVRMNDIVLYYTPNYIVVR